MCKSIEEYAQSVAEEKGIDIAINAFKVCGKKFDETIDYVCSQFPNTTREYITERFYALSDAAVGGTVGTTK